VHAERLGITRMSVKNSAIAAAEHCAVGQPHALPHAGTREQCGIVAARQLQGIVVGVARCYFCSVQPNRIVILAIVVVIVAVCVRVVWRVTSCKQEDKGWPASPAPPKSTRIASHSLVAPISTYS